VDGDKQSLLFGKKKDAQENPEGQKRGGDNQGNQKTLGVAQFIGIWNGGIEESKKRGKCGDMCELEACQKMR